SKNEQGEEDSKDVKKMSPFVTLEPAFETLNGKKFDGRILKTPWLLLKYYQYYNLIYRFLKLHLLWIHFTIKHLLSLMKAEPIKGLLLNNLRVYGGCRVLFDSSEIPEKCISSSTQPDVDDLIDLTFAKDYVEQMVLDVRTKDEISPTLRTIVYQFDDDNRRPEVHQFSGLNWKKQRPTKQADPMGYDHDHSGYWETSGADGSFSVHHEHESPSGRTVLSSRYRLQR
ncbi:hypothetical protein Droror1_Dr00000213, partial [Drosera rotundifolia]